MVGDPAARLAAMRGVLYPCSVAQGGVTIIQAESKRGALWKTDTESVPFFLSKMIV